MALASSKDLFGIQATIECRFTLKRVRAMMITYSYTVALLQKGAINQKLK